MKKILLMLMLFLGFGSITIMGQTFVRIYPKASFVGVTKKGTTYAKQSIEKDPKRFFVGYDATTSTYGRGYLEFDLSSLPKDVTIVSASLQLTSVIAYDNNFNGKIKLYSCGNYMDANEVIWNSLKGITNLDLISTDMQREGYGKALSNEALKITTKNAIGKKLYLAINHVDESKVIRFTGDIKDLYLDIEYKSASGETGGSTGFPYIDEIITSTVDNRLLSFTYPAHPGDTIICYCKVVNAVVKEGEISWTYNSDHLRRIPNKSDNDFKRITFVVKYTHTNIRSEIRAEYGVFKAREEVEIEGKPAKMIPSSSAVYQGNKITYTLDIPSNIRDQVVVNWEGSMLLSLLSGQGTCEAVYYAAREGNAIAKATVSYNGQSYTVEDSSVRIILDPNPSTISYNAIKNYTDISRYDRVGSLTFGSEIRGATKFQWYGGFPVEYKGSKTSAFVTVDKKHIISKGFGMTIWVTASNDKESVTIYYFVSVDGVGGLDPTI